MLQVEPNVRPQSVGRVTIYKTSMMARVANIIYIFLPMKYGEDCVEGSNNYNRNLTILLTARLATCSCKIDEHAKPF